MIKRFTLFILMIICAVQVAEAQVIVSEDFDYTAGSNLGNANGGTGWGGSWQALATERTIVDDTLRNYRIGKASGTYLDLSVTSAAENLRYQRALASDITDDGNTYWLGFTMDIMSTGGNVANLVLLDENGTSLKFIIGRIGNGKLAVGAPNDFESIDDISPNQLNWLVAKISFTGDTEEDTVRLFVNPDPEIEPTNDMAGATFSGTIMNTGIINSIMIRAEDITSITASFDDIYLGQSYNDVVPATAVDIAKYLPVREKFEYAADAGISGNGTASEGWGGPWELTGGVEQNVVSQQISNENILRTTIGNSLLMDNVAGETRLTRPLSQTYEDNGLTYWFSYFGDFVNADGNDIMLPMLINNDIEVMGPGGPGGQFAASGKWDGAFQFGLGKFSGGFDKEVTTLTEDGAHWLVTSIETNGTSDADTLRLFLDPNPGVEPQIGDEVAKFWSTRLNDGWKAIGIKNGPGNLKTNIDDMYLAIDYKDVVPEDLATIDAPPSPAFEKFEYTAGAGISGNGAIENGWSGPWELIGGPEQNVVNESIVNSNILKITTGNSLLMDAAVGETRIARPLASTYEDNGRTYWMSFFADFAGAEGSDLMTVMLINSDAETMGPSGPNGQFLAVGKWNAAFEFGLGKFSGGFAKSPNNVTLGQDGAHWFVVSIETNGTSDADTVRLFLNPDPLVEPINGTETVKYAATRLNDGWKAIGIKNGIGTLKSNIDDIHLGNSYGEVVPNDLIDVAIPSAAFEKFDYAGNETIEGKGNAENGWSGPWELVGGVAQNVVSDQVTNTEIFRQTTGNSLLIDATAGSTRLARPLADRYEDNGLTYWMSFFAEFNNTTDNGVTTVMLINNDTETMGASGPNGQFVTIGKWTSAGALAVGSFGPFEESVLPGVAEGTHWLVARIETNGTAAKDTVRLFLNPDPAIEPEVGSEVLKFAASELNGGWDAIGIKNDGGVMTTLIDDIYLGASYADAVPGDLIDVEFLFTAGTTYEPFSYTVDANIAGNGDRSNGFGGPWVRTSGEDITVSAGSIETDFTLFEGNKARVNVITDAIQYDRPLSGTFEDDGSTVWMSFLMDFETVEKISSEGQLVLMNGTEEVIGFGRTEGFNRIGFTWDDESFEFISDATTDDAHWVVVRIDMSGDSNAEDIYMWVDPVPDLQPGVNTAATFTNSTVDKRLAINEGFDGIRIKTGGGTPFSFFIDEIRLGYSYSDVTTIEEEVPEDLIAREQFRYPVGESLGNIGSAGGQWGGPWEAVVAGPAVIEAGSVTIPGLSSLDNKARLISTPDLGARYVRPLATPLTDDGNGYWFGFFGNVAPQGGVVAQGGFARGEEPMVIFGKKFSDANASILNIGGNSQTAQTEVPVAQSNWYVVYLQFSGDEEAETLSLWMNPDPEVTPDLNFPDATLEVGTLNEGFDHIFFRTEGGAAEYLIDEIHLGTTFESIVPQGEDGGEVTGIDDLINNAFKLVNHPNPFSTITHISYQLENSADLRLAIVDLQGREVVTLLDGYQVAGKHMVTWDGSDKNGNALPSGMYLYRLTAAEQTVTRRLMLLK